MYVSSDYASGRGQKRTKILVKLELSGLIIASLAGVASYRVGIDQFDLLAAASGLAFTGALISTAMRASQRPEGDWYVGRAAAESIRTMAWRYAVGGDPFPNVVPATEASARYLTRLEAILHELRETDLSSGPSGAHEITPAMNKVRAADLRTRRLIYQRDRVEDQLGWYQRRTITHKKKAARWFTITILASALGIVAAGLKFFHAIDFDMLGVFASIASAATAWNQLNQHRNLVSAYSLTASELGIIRDRIPGVPDHKWPVFVADCEDAISREHTMWLARHGHPSLPRGDRS
jgi:hypothetical protein